MWPLSELMPRILRPVCTNLQELLHPNWQPLHGCVLDSPGRENIMDSGSSLPLTEAHALSREVMSIARAGRLMCLKYFVRDSITSPWCTAPSLSSSARLHRWAQLRTARGAIFVSQRRTCGEAVSGSCTALPCDCVYLSPSVPSWLHPSFLLSLFLSLCLQGGRGSRT